ncbi:MAG: metallophosphoesterase [Clostridiales bacterium]|nr:metallophosphoesterase [Clostridiales bacterium]
MVLYAISDIHGFLDEAKETLKNVDLTDKRNKVVFCGDYIDGGPASCETLYFIKDFQKSKPSQTIVLMGNHEEMFLEYLFGEGDEWILFDQDLSSVKSFMSKQDFEEIQEKVACRFKAGEFRDHGEVTAAISRLCKNAVKGSHKELFAWLRKLPYHYETEKQIFVHAGIDEEAGELWKHGTPEHWFAGKFPATTGGFYKDIIAGHVGTSGIAGDPSFRDIYWDGKSHYYIDGTVKVSKCIPLLKYDTESGVYTGFRKVRGGGGGCCGGGKGKDNGCGGVGGGDGKDDGDGSEWEEYLIKKECGRW